MWIRDRLRRVKTPASGTSTLTHGGLELDEAGRALYVDGAYVPLTAKEFDLMLALMQNPGRVMTREALAARGWRPGMDRS